MANFKDRVRELRVEKGWTQDDLAKVLDLNNTTVSAYERGVRKPSFDALDTLAEKLDVDINYLLGNSDLRQPYPRSDESSEQPVQDEVLGENCWTNSNAVSVRLSPSELELVKDYRNAGRTVKRAVRTVLRNANATTLKDGTKVVSRRPLKKKK